MWGTVDYVVVAFAVVVMVVVAGFVSINLIPLETSASACPVWYLRRFSDYCNPFL